MEKFHFLDLHQRALVKNWNRHLTVIGDHNQRMRCTEGI